MNRFRYRQLLMLIALILPVVAIAALGWKNYVSYERERQNTQDKALSAIAQALLSKLESIKVGALGASSTSTWRDSNPAVILVASVSNSDGTVVLEWDSSSAGPDVHEQDLMVALQKNFHDLDLKEDTWKPWEPWPGHEGLWLSMTPPPRRSKQPLVIAVRAGDIIQQVREERESNGNTTLFRIEPGDTPSPVAKEQNNTREWILPLAGEIAVPTTAASVKSAAIAIGDRFPRIGIHFLHPGQGSAALDSQRFYAVSLSVVVALTFLGWYLLLRDTRREARLVDQRSQFVSSVSHEFKTPLTAIRMSAETLQMRGSTDPQIQREFLNTIVNESERLTRLLNNVLDFSRIERGQRSYHLVPTRLVDVVQSAARTMQFPLSEQGFDFQVDVCDGLPPMRLDRDALEQAILNLLSNAMKYSGDSRVIALKLRSETGSALIEVVDHGIGIAPEERKRIFETFYRVASPENRAISGTGLGLALIAHTAEAHGGAVEVASTPGKGSTFSIRIPFNGNGHA